MVTVQATLPAAKNTGVAITRTATITIQEPPPPENFTLRIIKINNGSDKVVKIAVIPARATFNDAIYATGHTGYAWAGTSGNDPTYSSNFVNWWGAEYTPTYYTLSKNIYAENEWVDVTIPWPNGDVLGWYVYFFEGDNRVRGYVKPAALDPPRKHNFNFLVRPDYLYANNYYLWMNEYKQAQEGTGSLVIPIGYHSYDNTASIMKAVSVGSRPRHDLD
jgi:hypothetical protein